MPLMLEDLKYNRLYRKDIFIPTNLDNRRKLASIVLLTPSYESSVRCMTYPKFINNKLYTSYYTEKDVDFIINHETSYMTLERDILQEAELFDNSIAKYNRATIPVEDVEDTYPDINIPDNVKGTAYIFTDSSNRVCGCVVININTLTYLWSSSHKTRFDLLDFAIDTVGVTSIVTDLDSDLLKRAKKEYDFIPSRGRWLVRNVFKSLKESSSKSYDPPMNEKEVRASYGNDIYNKLIKDEAHKFRMQTGIELIHKEPSIDELNRIMANWNLMDDSMKKKSDKKSLQLYGKINKDHYDELIQLYESTIITESVSLIDAEIKIWEAQILITKEMIKYFGDESWINSKFNSMKSKLIKIPINGYHNPLSDLDDLKTHLENQMLTLEFYTNMKALELKDHYDLSEIVDEYTYWVKALSCPKSLKIKILRRTISSYKRTIKEYERALADYERMSVLGRRIENLKALVSKTFSIFGFLTGGPLSPIKGIVLKAILPKSSKKSILSDDELKAKIVAYKKIVEVLENELQEVQALNESMKLTTSIPKKILDFNTELNSYPYAVILKNGKVEHNVDKIDFMKDYRTSTIEEFNKHKAGVCWDYVNSEANWFRKNGYKFETYYVQMENGDECPSHTFLVFRLPGSNKYYYFESSWKPNRGIYEVDTLEELFDFHCNHFLKEYGDHPCYVWRYDVSRDLEHLNAMAYMNKMYNDSNLVYQKNKLSESVTESTILVETGKYSNDQLYFAHPTNEYDNKLLSSVDPDKFLSIGITTAIGFNKKPQSKMKQYYIYQPDLKDCLKYKTIGGRVKLDNDTILRLVGEVEVSYDDWKGKVSDYNWIWHYDSDGNKVNSWQETTALTEGVGSRSIPKEITEFNEKLNQFEYGISINGKKLDGNKETYAKYKTLTPDEFVKNKIGICYDYVNYQAKWFKDHCYKFSTYYIRINDGNWNPDHTILVFYLPETNLYYYFESSWKDDNLGIFSFSSEEKAVSYVVNKMIHKEQNKNVEVHKYDCSEKLYSIPLSQFYNQVCNSNNKVHLEAKLSSKDRNDLPDSEFGIPHKRKYPLNDKSHVLSAVRMFNHVDKGDEELLAKNIQKKAKELGIELSVGPDNRLYRYLEESFRELSSPIIPIREDFIIDESSIMSKDYMTIFESSITEDSKYNASIKKMIYQDRIRNHQELLHYYDRVKEACPFITRTFLDYKKYMGYNLFIDMSYYMQSFIKHNYFKLDKGIKVMSDFISRFLDDKRLDSLEYKKKTVFIPVHDWQVKDDTFLWDYTNNINPISIIYRILKQGKDITRFKDSWGKSDFVFLGDSGYFKINLQKFDKKDLPRFLNNIKSLLNHERIDDLDEPDTSKNGIIASIADKIETANGKIEINNLVGSAAKDVDTKDSKKVSSDDSKSDREKKKEEVEAELVDNIKQLADTTGNEADVEKALDDDNTELKNLVVDLMSYNSIDITPTRSARITQLNNKFLEQKIKDVPISAMISDYQDKPLEPVSIPIDTINDDWKYVTSVSFNRSYKVDVDISKCIYHFGNCTIPVAARNINVEDTTTSEDSIETWTVQCEDAYGKRFTLKFDIPKIIDNRFMKLRGNMKTMSSQLMNLPIIKTARDTCQITSNYNKIFVRTFNTSSGKSNAIAARIIKTLLKLKESGNNKYDIELGDMTLISNKYELPLDYIDIGSKISKISYTDESKNKVTIYFNQDEFLKLYSDKIDPKKKDTLVFAVSRDKNNKENILYPEYENLNSVAEYIRYLLGSKEFNEVYNKTTPPVKCTYSKARIMSTEIPVAVLLCYALGLTAALKRMELNYTIEDKRPSHDNYDKDRKDCIKLADCWIVYENTYLASMILNGLKECDMAGYTLVECNTKKMWLDQLDLFGGRIKADGLDMFYDLMFDPMTVEICNKYKIPNNYCDALIYASHLLSDIKYNPHSDITGNRLRSMEIIAGYTYKVLATSYSTYRRELKAGRDASMSVKRSAVIDAILTDNTCSDLSILSPLLEVESANTVSFKGLSGMNTDRAYGLAERIYSDSMVNVLAMSTGFSANVGISRQTTIDMSVDTPRGYIKPSGVDEMSVTKSFCMTEALTPYGSNSDDPFRTAMTYIQTSKHGMITTISDPLLVTNGADQAIVYMTSDTFAYKAKGSGVVKELTDEYMVLEYKNGKTEVVDLRETMMKNSDGGMWVPVELTPKLKEGGHFKENDIVAVDSRTYSNIGITDNYSYNIGTFCKFAMICSETGYEDACIHTKWLSTALSSKVVDQKQYIFPKSTNVYEMAKKGQTIQEGEPLIIFQNSFDEDDANDLIRMLTNADEKAVSELGRIPIRSNITGVIDDIRIYRCVEIEELSPSLKKIVTDYERDVKKFNKVLEKYDPEKAKSAVATYKLEPTGKLKNCEDSIMIEFYISYLDEFSPADKIVNYSALKGVSSKQIPEGLECRSKYRPDEKIHYLQSDVGDMHRMVGSVLKIGALNKVLVETARKACDIMGIKWKYLDEY